MKIALLIKDFLAARGGGEAFAVNLARGLKEAGHEVDVYATGGEQIRGVGLHLLPSGAGPRFFRALSFSCRARKALAKEDYDIVYALSPSSFGDIYRPGGGVYSFWLKQRFPSPARRAFGCLFRPMHLVNLLLERKIFNGPCFSHFITNSQLVRRQLIEEKGLLPEMISLVYNGVDFRHFNPRLSERYREKVRKDLKLPARAPVVLFLANNYERKGLRTLLSALRAASEEVEDLALIVAGRSKARLFESLARRLGLSDAVHFVGFTSEPEKFFGASDLFILPTRYDPFANVCLEALASGLPVITTTANGASEIIKNGKNGFILEDARDFKALAGLIRRFFLEADRTRMSQAARQSVREFSIKNCVEKTLSVFEDVLREKKKLLGGRRAKPKLEV